MTRNTISASLLLLILGLPAAAQASEYEIEPLFCAEGGVNAPEEGDDQEAVRGRVKGEAFRIEAEAMRVALTRRAAAEVQGMESFGIGSWSADQQFLIKGQDGGIVELAFKVPEGGRYTIFLYATRAPNYGTWRASLDGKRIGKPFDAYAPVVMPTGGVRLGGHTLAAGEHLLGFEIVGKSRESRGFHAGIDALALYRGKPGAAGPQSPSQSPSPSFDDRLATARRVLMRMGEKPASIKSVNYHVLYVCREEFAKQRKVVLEFTRRNFLGFIRRMKLDINPGHEKLLMIVLDTQEQMAEFTRRSAPNLEINSAVARYYSPEPNWAVFFNQRKGSDLKELQRRLNDLARQLIAIRGGPSTKVEITTQRGTRTLTKQQLANEMKNGWKRIIREVSEFNTTVTQHEGAHQLAFNVGVQQRNRPYPFWVSEGLACLFEVPPRKGRLAQGAARVNKERLSRYRELRRQKSTLGLERLIRLRRDDRVASIDAIYAESWAVFAFLFHRHAAELSAYLNYLAHRPSRPDSQLYDEVVEFSRFFKQPLDVLQKELDKYVKRLR